MFLTNKYRIALFLAILMALGSCGVKKSIKNMVPDINGYDANVPQRIAINDSTFTVGSDYLTKNRFGQWELHVSGNPLQLGLKTGSLTQELFNAQEAVFVDKINELVPSKNKQNLLRKFLAWFNRKMYLNIDERFKAEIYGISKFASPHFDHIAQPYPRVMYFHGAHDIGHALQDLALVGCTSFAAWGDQTQDGKLLLGRNFDFYAGDAFSKHKIIAFVSPDEGHKFMSVTWGGFIGVLSGMNDQGLTVTINAGKSKFPLVAKTPISLVTREILQFASTLEEAIEIAKKREVFVSESILIGSAKDGRAAIIEVSPDNFGVYEIDGANRMICSNHFQSDAFSNDRKNQKHQFESHSKYRFERMQELLDENQRLTPQTAVSILRNREGLNDAAIGYGNEKALNQLLAHHGVVFQPEDLLVWVSSNPYQLGEFVAYDLDQVFNGKNGLGEVVAISNKVIEKDSFLQTGAYADYEKYRKLRSEINKAILAEKSITNAKLDLLIGLNPEYWEGYYLKGVYNYRKGYDLVALEAFVQAVTKEITTVPDQREVQKYISKLKKRQSR